MSLIKTLKFDRRGLIPAIIQDQKNGEVLMMAYMNRLAVKKTLQSKKTHFFSRSRKKMWLKGQTSGNFQLVRSVSFDCDKDTLLIKVKQLGGACHTGYRSCFYRRVLPGGKVKISGKRMFDPKKVYRK